MLLLGFGDVRSALGEEGAQFTGLPDPAFDITRRTFRHDCAYREEAAPSPVDLLCRSADGDTVAVEIKRKGEMDGVEQLTRYLDRLGNDSRLHPLRGVLAATIIAPQAKVLAAARGIACVEVDYEQLRGAPSNHLRLF